MPKEATPEITTEIPVRPSKQSAFLKHNAIFWTASLGVSFLNYLYYPVLGRLLHPTDFGEVQTIISLLTQAGVFFQVLGLVSVGIITKYANKEDREQVIGELSRLALVLPLAGLLACVFFSAQLQSFFHFYSAGPFFVLAVSLLLSVPLAFANSYLQGHKQFRSLSVSNLLVSGLKLLLAIIFVLLGFKVIGAIGGLAVAQLITLVYAVSKGQGLRRFIASNFHTRRFNLRLLRPELPYAGIVLVTALTTNLLLSFDILVVKHYFPPEQAGLYSGISIISNIIYFITAPFAAVLIPSLGPSRTKQENDRSLRHSLMLTLSVGGATTATFLLVPDLVVKLLLGHTYLPYAGNLRGLAIALFALSVANLLIYYHIGLRHLLVAPVVLAGLVGTIVLLVSAHATIGMVIRDLMVGGVGLLVLLILLTPLYAKGQGMPGDKPPIKNTT